MKTDVKGCSTTLAGSEHWEKAYMSMARREMVQYDYRTPQGRLFSCMASSLDEARKKRDDWISKEITGIG